MRLWLDGVEIAGGAPHEVAIEPLIPEHLWRAACTNPPAEWLIENPDLAELDAMLNGFYA